MQSIYRRVLTNAWELAWRTKWLWLFGFFAAFLGSGGNIDIVFNIDAVSGIEPTLQTLRDLHATGALIGILGSIDTFIRTNFGTAFVLALLFILIAFLVIWLITISQIAIIYVTQKRSKKEKTDYTEAFAAGRHYFLRVLGLNVIAKIVIYGILIALGGPVIAGFAAGSGSLLWEVLFVIVYIAAFIIVSLITFYATAAIVVDGMDVPRAITKGWQTLTQHWLINLEFTVFLIGINVLAALSFVLALFLIAIPLALLSLIFFLVASEPGLFLVITVSVIVLLVFVAVFNAILSVFQYSAWTHVYKELNAGRGISKIVRLFAHGKPS